MTMFRVLVPSIYVQNPYPATNRYIVDMMLDAMQLQFIQKPKCNEMNFSPWTFCPVLPDSVCVCVLSIFIGIGEYSPVIAADFSDRTFTREADLAAENLWGSIFW